MKKKRSKAISLAKLCLDDKEFIKFVNYLDQNKIQEARTMIMLSVDEEDEINNSFAYKLESVLLDMICFEFEVNEN